MSKEALVEFMSKLSQDTALQDGLRGLVDGEGGDAAVSTDAFVEYAQENGFEFTTEEALGAFELSDDELESVSGGAVFAKYDGFVADKHMPDRVGLKGSRLPLQMLGRHGAFKF